MKLLSEKVPDYFQRFKHGDQSNVINLLYSYRYGSLTITSVYYLLGGPLSSSIFYKFVAIVSLCVVAKNVTDMYVKNLKQPKKLQSYIMSETLIITLLLIPTGGLNSPFIWYALNPVLVAAKYLSSYFCWFNLSFYMISATWISAIIFNKGQIIDLMQENSYLFLVFILITLLVQSLATVLKHLNEANQKQKETLEQLMSLYHILENFSNQEDIDHFFSTITKYAAKLTKANSSFFWGDPASNSSRQVYTNMEIPEELQTRLDKELKAGLVNLENRDQQFTFQIADQVFHAVLVKSSAKFYGVLGIEAFSDAANAQVGVHRQLTFLAELSVMILERFALGETNDRLMILEERNRIANEIHDSVLQRLFSINCSLHTLKTDWPGLNQQDIEKQLDLLAISTSQVRRELRQSIYSLSTQKSGESILFSSIKAYLHDLAKLNDIEIKLELNGEEELLSARLKKCLYRLVCEISGNAVRHGKCDVIQIALAITPQVTKLSINDNGIGFEPGKVNHERSGLGLVNMKHIVQSFAGELNLSSQPGFGTRVQVELPNAHTINQRRGGIA